MVPGAVGAWRKEVIEKLGGFSDIAEWLDSAEGQAMLSRGSGWQVSLTDLLGEDDGQGQELQVPDLRGNPAGDIEALALLAEIHRDAGERLQGDAVLDAFFRECLLGGREALGEGGLLEDTGFLAQAQANPRYARLDAESLAAGFFIAAKSLIAEILLETQPASVPPLVQAYLRWVVVEERPERGKDGLFSQKPFKTLLAQDPALHALAPDTLGDRLWDQALALLQQLIAARN